jgi:hypothetical protein
MYRILSLAEAKMFYMGFEWMETAGRVEAVRATDERQLGPVDPRGVER